MSSPKSVTKSTKDDRDLDTPKTNSKRKRTSGKEKVCTNLDSVMSYMCTHIIFSFKMKF